MWSAATAVARGCAGPALLRRQPPHLDSSRRFTRAIERRDERVVVQEVALALAQQLEGAVLQLLGIGRGGGVVWGRGGGGGGNGVCVWGEVAGCSQGGNGCTSSPLRQRPQHLAPPSRGPPPGPHLQLAPVGCNGQDEAPPCRFQFRPLVAHHLGKQLLLQALLTPARVHPRGKRAGACRQCLGCWVAALAQMCVGGFCVVHGSDLQR